MGESGHKHLYMNALTINGTAHNVLFVGTDKDTMYALDADTGTQLWSTSLIPPGGSAVAGTMVDDRLHSVISGILGTPAIDNGTLYVVAETAEQNATVFPHHLHALDIATGQEKLGGPVLISDGPTCPLPTSFSEPGLRLPTDTVYVSFGSLADKAPYRRIRIRVRQLHARAASRMEQHAHGQRGRDLDGRRLSQCRQLRKYLCPYRQWLRRWR